MLLRVCSRIVHVADQEIVCHDDASVAKVNDRTGNLSLDSAPALYAG